MPTKHDRISVVKDAELAAVIEETRRLPGFEGRPAAAILRELALQGAAFRRSDDERRRRLRLDLDDAVASGAPPWDAEVLADVDARAWGP